jgi:hypothetical protein
MAACNRLFTKTAFRKVPALYATEKTSTESKVAWVKIFSIRSDHRHYIIEFDPETGIAFALTTNQDVCEFGYIDLNEMQSINDNFRQHGFRCPPLEREIHGTPSNGYNIAKVQEAHARQWNAPQWAASVADGRAEVIPT